MQEEKNQRNLAALVQEEENKNHTDSQISKKIFVFIQILMLL